MIYGKKKHIFYVYPTWDVLESQEGRRRTHVQSKPEEDLAKVVGMSWNCPQSAADELILHRTRLR